MGPRWRFRSEFVFVDAQRIRRGFARRTHRIYLILTRLGPVGARVKVMVSTNTKSLAKEFSKILIIEYFDYVKIGFDVFFDADSESPRMT